MWNGFVRVGSTFVFLCLNGPLLAEETRDRERPRARIYTNEDLARVAPLREQTGVSTAPVEVMEGRPADSPNRAAQPGHDGRPEAYWRREATRVRERVSSTRASADALRRRIDARWRRPGLLPSSDPTLQAWQGRLRVLEDRIRELEADLEDRARRDGAMPGWLR